MRSVGLEDFFTFFFRPQGRIARREYALGAGLIFTINAALFALLLTRESWATLAAVLMLSLWLPLLVAQLVLAAKRCHDLGISGAFCLILGVPFFGIFGLIALAFAAGTDGPNAYGPPPAFRAD
ncbi:DUF805 domain-containing protein [Bauldia litoralis]|uniref:Uncharacterized membrane protein YhaH, DUF805 family n=1 Tax=Bauldia litoralis TaxID=665467 RepID=A0A1G6E652_9HYPH|nr:DUF805 domain-containing protein [Bauldia litoralis]SDB52800.1 Uncharacterized membrane protein YhaH, DUF805 family [Bauldia litoralis]